MNGWLPDIDSIELIERVRKLGHKFPIMAVIPHEGSESHRESIYSKVNDIVYKPPYLQPVKEIFLKWFSEPL
jgi:CheY-like chemotaxis protein